MKKRPEVTPCKTETHRHVDKTKHGVINRDVKLTRGATPAGELKYKGTRKSK